MTFSRNRQSVTAAILSILLAALVFTNPLPEPALSLARLVLFVAMITLAVLVCRQSRDEVVIAANRAAMAWGAPLGLGLAFLSVFVMRFTAPVADLVARVAHAANNPMPPAAVGFGMGVVFTSLIIGGCISLFWAGWWVAKR